MHVLHSGDLILSCVQEKELQDILVKIQKNVDEGLKVAVYMP